jgi:hypothetical protein
MAHLEQEKRLINELKSKFEHPIQRIRRVRTTNEIIVRRLVKQDNAILAECFPNASEEDAMLISAAFHYLTVNGLFPEDYEFVSFVRDLNLIHISTSNGSHDYEITETLDLAVRILVQSISASFEVLVTAIDEKTSKTPDTTVQSLILYKHFVRTADIIGSSLSNDPEETDVRLVGAILQHGVNMMFRAKRRQVPIWSISDLHDAIISKYPLSKGSDLYWDLTRTVILVPNYERIIELGAKTIRERLEALERERKAARTLRSVKRPSTAGDGVTMVGEVTLQDILRRGRDFTSERTSKLQMMFDRSLRQAANKKYGKQDLPDPELLLDIATAMFSELTYEFEALLASVLPPLLHSEFFEAPKAFLNCHKQEIPGFVKKKLTHLTRGSVTTSTLAKAFIRLIRTAVSVDFSKKRIY